MVDPLVQGAFPSRFLKLSLDFLSSQCLVLGQDLADDTEPSRCHALPPLHVTSPVLVGIHQQPLLPGLWNRHSQILGRMLLAFEHSADSQRDHYDRLAERMCVRVQRGSQGMSLRALDPEAIPLHI